MHHRYSCYSYIQRILFQYTFVVTLSTNRHRPIIALLPPQQQHLPQHYRGRFHTMMDDDDGTSRTHPQQPLPSPQQGSFCFPKLTKMTKRSRSDLNDDGGDARHVVATSTTATSKVDDTQPQLHQEVIAPPPTKKLFSIFHFQKTKQQQKERPLPFSSSSSSFKTQPQPQVRNHSTTTSSSTSSTDTTTDVARMQRNIFVDLDGVLVDFDYGVQQLEQIYDTSKNPKKPSKFNLWSTIQRTKYFYRTLPWTKDGKELWSFLVSLRSSSSFCSNTTTTMLPPPLPQPSSIQLHILTGVPWNCHAAAALDKFHWCQRELQWSNDRTTTTTTTAAAATAVMALPSSIIPSSVFSVTRSTTSSTTVSATPTTNHQNETAAVTAIVAAPDNVSKNNSTLSSIPATTTTTTTTKSNVLWHWRNMAGPRNTHQHINEVVPTTVATDHGSGDEYRPSVITCWSIHKHLECCRRTNSGGGGGDILIDDRPMNHQLQQKWEAAGGIFIHHTSTRSTIRQLQRILGQESHFV